MEMEMAKNNGKFVKMKSEIGMIQSEIKQIQAEDRKCKDKFDYQVNDNVKDGEGQRFVCDFKHCNHINGKIIL